MTKELSVTRWGLGGSEITKHEFPDLAVLEALEDGNVQVVDEPDGQAVAFFAGISEAWWV